MKFRVNTEFQSEIPSSEKVRITRLFTSGSVRRVTATDGGNYLPQIRTPALHSFGTCSFVFPCFHCRSFGNFVWTLLPGNRERSDNIIFAGGRFMFSEAPCLMPGAFASGVDDYARIQIVGRTLVDHGRRKSVKMWIFSCSSSSRNTMSSGN